MSVSKYLKIINPLLGLTFLWMLGTAVFRDFLPKGMFGNLHKPGGFVFFAFAVIHIILNWSWIKSTYLKKKE